MSERKRKSIFEIFEDLIGHVDKVFEELVGVTPFEAPLCDISKRELKPLVHVYETEDEVVVTIDLPYVKKEDIRLSASENMLKIEAPARERIKLSRWGPYQREVEFEYFRRTITLPAVIDPEKARARFKDGILQVTLPKKIYGYRIVVE
ncbi:TPA: Hsp20/alpha crystallin family protein [Candidatus Bathyarchaeota archaeon]|nr:Hsp20/alpha crystallin family protein [Candidatus Bathyarchaeota archaeon]